MRNQVIQIPFWERLLSLEGRRFNYRHLLILILAIFLPLAGTSLSELPSFTGNTPTVNISSIPRLAAALGLTKPTKKKLQLKPVKQPAPIVVHTPPPPPPVVITYSQGHTPNTLSTPASNLLPGAVIERGVILSNKGNGSIVAVSLSAAIPNPSPLVTNPSYGLQVRILSCSVPWTWVTNQTSTTYSCSGSELATTYIPVVNVVHTPIPISGLSPILPGSKDELVIELRFPLPAPISLSGLSSTINWSFIASGF